MNMRLFKKDLKSKGLTIKSLLAFFDEFKKGAYMKKENIALFCKSPSPNAYIYKSELDFISKCILDYKNIETGGQLFGYWTADGSPVVAYTIGPGPRANHQVAFFNQDIDYLLAIGNVLVQHYGLQHIGEWHSHHKLGLAQPSGHDASTMAETIKEKHLTKFLLCIGNCTDYESSLNPFNFTYDAGYNYVKAEWIVKSINSPYRDIIDKELRGDLIQPSTITPRYNIVKVDNNATTFYSNSDGYWFEHKQNRLILKSIMDFVSKYQNSAHCSIQMDSNKHILLLVKGVNVEEQIYFPSQFPQIAPEIHFLNPKVRCVSTSCTWDYHGNIFESFVKYYKSLHN